MPCDDCVIIGDGPIADEVNQRIAKLPPAMAAKFKVVYAIYEKNEKALTADQACYILLCAMTIIQTTAT
jgi:hypothetical protein